MGKKHRSRLLLLAGIVALGVGLGAWGEMLAQAQPQLTSQYVAEPMPLTDPQSPFWEKIAAVDLPLSAQSGITPSLPEPSVKSVRVRSVNDGQWVSFLLEWGDATQDLRASRPDQFRDAAALQLPVDTSKPGVCMGLRGQPVNLWHWKADWQTDIDQGYQDVVDVYPNFWKDYYPFVVGQPPYRLPRDFGASDARAYLAGWSAGNPLSDPLRVTPVEELRALGFGTATTAARQSVLGRGLWRDGRWRVVFSRPMAAGEESAVQFKPGERVYVAIAVWNGSNQEVGARKQLTADMLLNLQAPPAPGAPAPGGLPWWMAVVVGVVALVLGGAAAYGYLRRSKG